MNRSQRALVWLAAPVLYVGEVAGLTEANRDNLQWLRHGREVDAVIVHEGDRYEDGQDYDVQYDGGSVARIALSEDLDVGDRVTVWVHPDDPSRVILRSSLEGEIALGFVIAAALYVAPVVALIAAIDHRRRRPRADRPWRRRARRGWTIARWIDWSAA